MDEGSAESDDAIERLIEDFVARVRAGDSLSIESFCAQHAAHASELRELLPALLALENAGTVVADAPTLRRLGRYRIVREIGRGGMGVVFEAVQEPLGRRVALKVLPHHRLALERDRLRFQREAELAARLDDPGICTVYDSGVESGLPYIAMRFVEGQTLSDHIDSTRSRLRGRSSSAVRVVATPRADDSIEHAKEAPHGKNDVRRVTILLARVARSLHAAHEHGLVHRDVKPGNIMLTHAGEPVILDFGLARADDETLALTQTGEACGTPAYMAPEQVNGAKQSVDARTDVYQLGVTLFECLTLRRPFEPDNRAALYRSILFEDAPDVRRFNSDVGADLAAILARALEKDPSSRYSTAIELALDLERAAHGLPVSARPIGPARRLWRRARSQPWRAAALSAIVLVAIGAPIFYSSHRSTERRAVHAEELADKATERADSTYASARSTLDELVDRVRAERLEGNEEAEPIQRELLAHALGAYRTFLDTNGGDPRVRRDVALAHRRIGLIHREFGEIAAAESAFDRAISAFETIAADPEAHAENLYDLAEALFDRGDLCSGLTQWSLAERDLTHALRAIESPRAVGVSDDSRALLHASLRMRVASVVANSNRHAEAESLYRSVLDELDDVERAHGRSRSSVFARSMAQSELGLVLNVVGRRLEGEELQRESIRELTRWYSKHRDDATRERIAHRLLALATIQSDLRRFNEAADALRAAIAIREELLRAVPGDVHLTTELARTHFDLGRVCLRDRCYEDAELHLTRALEMHTRLERDHPEVASYRLELASTMLHLGNVVRFDRRARAIELWTAAIDMCRKYLDAQPDFDDAMALLGQTLDSLATEFSRCRAPEQSEPLYLESLALRETVVELYPRNARAHNDLGMVLSNLANICYAQQRFDELRTLSERAFEHQLLAVELRPDDPEFQASLIRQASMSASWLASVGDHRGVFSVIDPTSRALAQRADFLPVSAEFMAHAVHLAAEDFSLEESVQAELVARYERACVDHLRNMLAAKLDVLRFVDDPVFDMLREGEPFRQLVTDAQSRR